MPNRCSDPVQVRLLLLLKSLRVMRVHFLRLPKHHNLKLWSKINHTNAFCGDSIIFISDRKFVVESFHYILSRVFFFFFFCSLIINHLCLSLRVYFEMKSVLFDSLGCMCTQCHKRTVISLLVCLNIYIHAYNQLYGIYLLSTYILTSIHACIVHTTITYIKT